MDGEVLDRRLDVIGKHPVRARFHQQAYAVGIIGRWIERETGG